MVVVEGNAACNCRGRALLSRGRSDGSGAETCTGPAMEDTLGWKLTEEGGRNTASNEINAAQQ